MYVYLKGMTYGYMCNYTLPIIPTIETFPLEKTPFLDIYITFRNESEKEMETKTNQKEF